MKYPKFSHKTPHLKGKQHQLDPNLDLKQLVHHATVQYVDRDADGDVDVYDKPSKKTPDENPTGVDFETQSKKLIAKQKGEMKHTKRGVAYEEKKNGRCPKGQYWCYTNKECKPIPAGFMVDPEGMLRKENGASVDESKSGDSSLRDWFSKSRSSDGTPGWVQLGGKYAGKPCAKQPGQTTKPKCGSSKMKADLSDKEEERAFRRKNRQDPNPDRRGKAKNVATEETKKDHEYSMARSEIKTVKNAAKRLEKKMGKKGEGNLEAWVQSKITKAADYIDTAADYVTNEAAGEKDACYHKVKSRYKVWPSAYASGALVKCRKKGASNWGNKTEELSPLAQKILSEVGLDEKCWPGYEKKGMKTMFGKRYPNCVKKEDVTIEDLDGNTFAEVIDIIKPEPMKGVKVKEERGECSHTEKGKKCPIHGEDECPAIVDEAVRVPSRTGNIILVSLNWRAKYYMIKLFFPQTSKPNRQEVQDQIEKVYPGAKVQSYYVSDIKPGEQFLQVSEEDDKKRVVVKMPPQGGSAAKPGPDKNYVKPMGEEAEIDEDWQSVNRKDKTDGLSPAAVKAYRRENPGSKLKTAVTKKPSELKAGSKDAKRRKSFCSRMSGMKKRLTSAKTARDPDSRINKALRRWNCN